MAAKKVKLEQIFQSSLEQYPDHVKAIGMISVEQANLEIKLAQLLGALLNLDPVLADAVYFSPQATGARISIIENVSELILSNGAVKDVRKLLSKAREVVGRRNEYIHNAWGLHVESGQLAAAKLPIKGPLKTVTLKDLEDLVYRYRKLIISVHTISPDVHRLLWPGASLYKSEKEDHSARSPPPRTPKDSSVNRKPRARRKASTK